MPSDIMDPRHMSSLYRPSVPSSFFTEEALFPSEKQVGFWKTASVPDNRGLEAMSFMSGGKAVSSSSLEKISPMGGNFVNCLELPHNLFKDPKINMPHNFVHQLMGAQDTANCWRAPDQDAASLYGQPASLSALNKRVTLNGAHYENGLFSSSLSDIFNNKLRLSSSDAFVGQAASTTQPDFVEDEAFASLEEIEAQTIGDLLPDDDDLLSGAIHDLGYVVQSNKVDIEDDLFCSVGGMELESNDNFSCKKASDYGGAFNSHGMGLNNLPASNLPHGEQPSRTLFVRNIDSNMEDVELRAFFEQYGDIRTLHTSFRHRGFIMVSYYDIRAAENALRVLQTKSIRGQKLDIQFCISKDNPSEKDINEGMLLVTNLESSISNDDLLHIFGVYGEIKEICAISHQEHHKFIEFYDVRAAEAAISALNRRDVAGKRIKDGPCGLRDTGSGSMRQILSANLEEESRRCGPDSYSHKLPSECFVPSGLMTLGANTSSCLHKFSPVRVAMIGNQGNQSELSHSLGQMNLGYQSMSTFPCDGAISGIPFNSPSTISAMAMSVSSTLATGVDNRNTHRVGSGVHSSPSFEQNEAVFNVSGNGSCPLKSHEYIWNNSNAYLPHHPSSMLWQNFPQFMNNIPAQTSQVHGVARGPSHMPKPVLPHQHVGSAPTVDPLLWNRRHSFSGDAASFHPSSLGSVGYSNCSPVHSLELASHNIFPRASGTCIDPSNATTHVTTHVGVPSPQQRSHMFRGRNNVNPTPNSHDTHDRIRSRRSDASANQADSRKQYELDIDRIIRGDDSRTTLMIKNIPNKYTSKMLLATIDEQHKGTYDFIYLPIDFKNKCNVGYAFINMTDPQHIIPFYQVFNGKKWEKFNSEKVAYLAYARIQGKTALIAHFQNSSLMNEDKRCRPILFHSDGPNAGDQEPFPVGVNIRSRRSRTNTDNHEGSPSGSSSGDESSSATGSSSGSGKDSLSDRANFAETSMYVSMA